VLLDKSTMNLVFFPGKPASPHEECRRYRGNRLSQTRRRSARIVGEILGWDNRATIARLSRRVCEFL
jgi:hypothetical protein